MLDRRGGEYDPRVRTRIERASDMTAVEYIRLRAARRDLIGRVAAQTSGFDALLMPAVAITAPPIAEMHGDHSRGEETKCFCPRPHVSARCQSWTLLSEVRPPAGSAFL